MNSQESYLLQLIQKVEQLEGSMNQLEQIKKSQNQFTAQVSITEQQLIRLHNTSLVHADRLEGVVLDFKQTTENIPRRIPKSITIKLEKGSFLEIARSLLLLFFLSLTIVISARWVQYRYFDTYKNAWETVYQENNRNSQRYLDKKLNEFKNKTFWQKLKK